MISDSEEARRNKEQQKEENNSSFESDSTDSVSTNERKQRSGFWTFEERNAFEKALEKHGRDWKAISNEISSRTVNQIKIHAKNYFLHLLKRGKNLPAKVLETGQGYTSYKI